MAEHVTILTVVLVLVSPIVGSFLGVVIARLPAGRPFLWQRSECDACSHPLGPLDLVPFASWAFARARCRYCNARLSAFYPLIELAAVVVAVWSALATTGWRLVASCAIGWVLLVAAAIAWRKNTRVFVPALALAAWLVWLYML